MRTALLERLSDAARDRCSQWAGLDDALAAIWSTSIAAWPVLASQPERVGGQLAGGIDDDADPEQAFAAIAAEDLALACACASGDDAAIAAFDARLGSDIDLACARGGEAAPPRDEFRQRVRERLFVAAGREPRIGAYGGRGTLRAWVRVTAARVLIDIVRKATPPDAPASDTRIFDRAAESGDAELEYMRKTYGAAVPDAMAQGLAALTVRQRNLLRQRYLSGLSTDRLATMYGVHRATAFRWLEEARLALFAAMRAALGQRLAIADRELDSMIDLLASRVDVSMRRLLDSRIEE
jgi:RNA polymerase sigma-70 factor (ECF subfamily)